MKKTAILAILSLIFVILPGNYSYALSEVNKETEGRIEEIRADAIIIDIGGKDGIKEKCRIKFMKSEQITSPISGEPVEKWKDIGEGIIEYVEDEKSLIRNYIVEPGESLQVGYKVRKGPAEISYNKWESKYKIKASVQGISVASVLVGGTGIILGDMIGTEITGFSWIFTLTSGANYIYNTITMVPLKQKGKKKGYVKYYKHRINSSDCKE